MRFGVIVEARYLDQRMPGDLVAWLEACDHDVQVFRSDRLLADAESMPRFFDACDAVISRDRSTAGLALLAAAEIAGVPTVNSRAAIERTRNKAEMSMTLAAAGIAMPTTTICGTLGELVSLPDSCFPLVLKPNFGDNGIGVRRIDAAAELSRALMAQPGMLAQQFVPNDGFDLKLYVAGERVWAVRKENLWTGRQGCRAFDLQVDDEMDDLARRAGRALGLTVFGVDALQTAAGLRVIEVNEFPNFTGVAAAPAAIADVMTAVARLR